MLSQSDTSSSLSMPIRTQARRLHRSIGRGKTDKKAKAKKRGRAKIRGTMENQATSMEFLLLQEVQFLEVKDDALSQWEFVNVLDTEEGEEICDGGDNSVQIELNSWSISPNSGPIECGAIHYRLLHPDVEMKEDRDVDDDGNGDRHFDDGDADGYGGRQEENDDEDDDGDAYDLDDELVPWSVSSKFGRQRMRKLGKRPFSKMHNSKRSPHLFVRSGCVHGKHGLGLKHNY